MDDPESLDRPELSQGSVFSLATITDMLVGSPRQRRADRAPAIDSSVSVPPQEARASPVRTRVLKTRIPGPVQPLKSAPLNTGAEDIPSKVRVLEAAQSPQRTLRSGRILRKPGGPDVGRQTLVEARGYRSVEHHRVVEEFHRRPTGTSAIAAATSSDPGVEIRKMGTQKSGGTETEVVIEDAQDNDVLTENYEAEAAESPTENEHPRESAVDKESSLKNARDTEGDDSPRRRQRETRAKLLGEPDKDPEAEASDETAAVGEHENEDEEQVDAENGGRSLTKRQVAREVDSDDSLEPEETRVAPGASVVSAPLKLFNTDDDILFCRVFYTKGADFTLTQISYLIRDVYKDLDWSYNVLKLSVLPDPEILAERIHDKLKVTRTSSPELSTHSYENPWYDRAEQEVLRRAGVPKPHSVIDASTLRPRLRQRYTDIEEKMLRHFLVQGVSPSVVVEKYRSSRRLDMLRQKMKALRHTYSVKEGPGQWRRSYYLDADGHFDASKPDFWAPGPIPIEDIKEFEDRVEQLLSARRSQETFISKDDSFKLFDDSFGGSGETGPSGTTANRLLSAAANGPVVEAGSTPIRANSSPDTSTPIPKTLATGDLATTDQTTPRPRVTAAGANGGSVPQQPNTSIPKGPAADLTPGNPAPTELDTSRPSAAATNGPVPTQSSTSTPTAPAAGKRAPRRPRTPELATPVTVDPAPTQPTETLYNNLQVTATEQDEPSVRDQSTPEVSVEKQPNSPAESWHSPLAHLHSRGPKQSSAASSPKHSSRPHQLANKSSSDVSSASVRSGSQQESKELFGVADSRRVSGTRQGAADRFTTGQTTKNSRVLGNQRPESELPLLNQLVKCNNAVIRSIKRSLQSTGPSPTWTKALNIFEQAQKLALVISNCPGAQQSESVGDQRDEGTILALHDALAKLNRVPFADQHSTRAELRDTEGSQTSDQESQWPQVHASKNKVKSTSHRTETKTAGVPAAGPADGSIEPVEDSPDLTPVVPVSKSPVRKIKKSPRRGIKILSPRQAPWLDVNRAGKFQRRMSVKRRKVSRAEIPNIYDE